MNDLITGFIDSYDFLTVLVDKTIKGGNLSFFLVDENENKTKLELISCYEENEFFKFILKYEPTIKLYKDYIIEDNHGHRGKLNSGSIIRHPDFDKHFSYDGPLGVEYHNEYTIFRVWTPVAKELYVDIVYPKHERHEFTYVDRGLWECKIDGDLEGYGYLLSVRVFDEIDSIIDPYAISASANCRFSYVINSDKLYKMKYEKPYFSGIYTDAIIYEAGVRDFTCTLDGTLKGTYLGMLENNPTRTGEPTGLDYIQSLGITHLQLMPTFEFGGVDDLKKSSHYNWGYNPVGYFTPSGWLSQNPNDPYSRINELKELIDEVHKRGMRVTMDVVFNHVYKCETFAFDYLVPGYNYRLDLDGKMNNASGCGNVIATERYMCSRFVRDVMKYYAVNYKVDGFRFDLMGLLDIDTLNLALDELRQIEPKTIMYGEGWNMANPLPEEKRPHMFNHRKLPDYAFFNDRFRELLKGNQWNRSRGFAFGEAKSEFDISHLIAGSCLDYFKFDEPTQTINYVECHDNYTMYDYGKYALGMDDDALYYSCKLALEMIIISEGVPFIHSGEEFLRTKNGIENSYNSKDIVNKIDYRRRDKYIDLVNSVRALIKIRKEYPELRLPNSKAIDRRIHLLEGLCNGNTLSYIIEGTCYDLYAIIKNNYSSVKFELNANMIYDGKETNVEEQRYELINPGLYLFKKIK